MSQFDEALSAQPFYDAMRRGPEAEITFLTEMVQQAAAEGTGEDVWYVSWNLVNAYARNEQVEEAVAVAERLLRQPGATPQICTYIAETLHRHLGATSSALALLQKCHADLESAWTLQNGEGLRVAMLSLELAILAAEDPYAERVFRVAGEIQWHATTQPTMNDDLLEAIRILVPLGVIHRGHRFILELMWAQCQRKMKFERMSKTHRRDLQGKIEEVESLIDALQVRRSPPKRPKSFAEDKNRLESGSEANLS